MIKNKNILFMAAVFCMATLPATAQTNGSNSPYSRFGLGNLNDHAQGFNKAMSGLGIGIRNNKFINMQNPASYSAIDSLTFLFDVGMTFQNANFKNGNQSINAHNTTLDYVNAAFRLAPGLGISFGFVPYSTIGYNFSESKYLGEHFNNGNTITYTNTYTGDGGIHETYIGLGWRPFAQLSIGANAGFLWGEYSQNVKQTFYENGTESTSSKGLNRNVEANFSTYKIDFGAQYPISINKNNDLTLGVTYSLGHTIKNPARYSSYVTDGDSTNVTIKDAFDYPHTIGAGLSWQHNNKLTIGADVSYQKWGSCRMPQIINDEFVSSSANYKDRTRFVLGGEYQPDPISRKYIKRIYYRFGASYATPYYKINGVNGPREIGVTAGVGLPLSNKISSRSYINVSFQWLNVSADSPSLITENYLRLNIGITFNEKWFMKWKIQ